MISRKAFTLLGCGFGLAGALFAFQKPFHQFPGVEYFEFETPPDWQEKTEWTFARLMFPPGPNDGYSTTGRFTGDFRQGLSLWTQDYPRADRHFSQAVRRLTRIHARSVEQPVTLEDGDEAYNWPWLYAVQVGEWGLDRTGSEDHARVSAARRLLHGRRFPWQLECSMFEQRIKKVFPDRPIVDIPDDDAIFHTVYDLDDRFQIPARRTCDQGCKNCEDGGVGAHWRGIYDDKGRIMVAISYNSDIGDAWE